LPNQIGQLGLSLNWQASACQFFLSLYQKSENRQAMADLLLAFDFDGVICDSAAETGTSGWRAARTIWPDLPPLTEELIDAFCQVRPVLHTGWQSILLIRLLTEGVSTSDLLADKEGRLPIALMQRQQLNREHLIHAFGAVRDNWMQSDLPGWLQAHQVYPGILEPLKRLCKSATPPVVITTKQQRFACELLTYFEIPLAPDRVYGLETGPKEGVLTNLLHDSAITKISFVEDRLATLLEPKIMKNQDISRIFAEWGYCTESDIAVAKSQPEIQSFSLPLFAEFLSSYS
jgi:phosphoglycolate phosphatase-like HAD superfamily hydrolase